MWVAIACFLRWRVTCLNGQRYLGKPVDGITQQGIECFESCGQYLVSVPSRFFARRRLRTRWNGSISDWRLLDRGASFVEARIRSHVAKPSCPQRSAQRLLHDRGPHYARHSFGHLLPLRIFDHEFFATIFCEPVILGLTIANRPRGPLENHPAPLLHPMSRRIE